MVEQNSVTVETGIRFPSPTPKFSRLCKRCKAPFETNFTKKIFCSRKCNWTNKKTGAKKEWVCPDCGDKRVSKLHGVRVGLCRPCVVKRITGLAGKNNPAWKGGHESWQAGKMGLDKDGLSWKHQRTLAWERDKYTCQDCDKAKFEKRKPDVHHIIPYRISFSHALDNLRTLCQKCHKKADAKIPELWGGKTFGGKVSKTPKEVCSNCDKKQRLVVEGKCSWCRLVLDSIPEAKKMYEAGIAQGIIATKFGVHRTTVVKWIGNKLLLRRPVKYYRQCKLQKGITTQTAWLEEKQGLCEGAGVELKSEIKGDKQGWEVLTIGGRADQEFLTLQRGFAAGGVESRL